MGATRTQERPDSVAEAGSRYQAIPPAGPEGLFEAEPAGESMPTAGSASSESTPAPTDAPALRKPDGNPLPQTDELPSLGSPWAKRSIELLFAAIVADDAAIASSAFFPLVAYEQVKAISQPARDWQSRLFAAFRRDIHEYHRQLGREPTKARLLGLESSSTQPRWMKPGSEGNTLGYYRLLRAGLKLTDSAGRERRLEITSMISWRGEWYIVHLHGFK